jgi:glycosyltransferase involved in cell wall biosynthesis
MTSSVSVIIPCRNEQGFIAACLESVIGNDYPRQLVEILVVDGASTDGTREIVASIAGRHSGVRMLDNPERTTPAGLNIGVASATGAIVLRMDAHASYDPHYISRCVNGLLTLPAGNVGGIWRIRPRRDALLPWSIVQSLSHRFGIGNALYRLDPGPAPVEVDTVPYFCMRRETLQQVGPFNESLSRGQDMEFSLRVRAAGFRTFLIPDVVSYYYARTALPEFIRHNFINGMWAILPFAYTAAQPVSARHLIPLALVLWVILSLASWAVTPLGRIPLTAALFAYAVATALASIDVAIRRHRLAYVLTMPLVFPALHFSYGLGSLVGVFRLVSMRRQREGRAAAPAAPVR